MVLPDPLAYLAPFPSVTVGEVRLHSFARVAALALQDHDSTADQGIQAVRVGVVAAQAEGDVDVASQVVVQVVGDVAAGLGDVEVAAGPVAVADPSAEEDDVDQFRSASEAASHAWEA